MNKVPDTIIQKAIDQVFYRFDRDNSGTLDQNELVPVIQQVFGVMGNSNSTVNKFMIKQAFKRIDSDRDGRVTKI